MLTNKLDNPCQENQIFDDFKELPICKFADTILQIASLLLESGAHCERINRNIQRIAKSSCYNVEMFITYTAISVSVKEKQNSDKAIMLSKEIKYHGAHFGILAETSLLTWNINDHKISFSDLDKYLIELRNLPRYNIWIVRIFIALACCCLCLLSGGNWIDGIFSFAASFIGLIVRQEIVHRGYNLIVAFICSAFTTTLFSEINSVYSLGRFPESSIATAVLFLIPGVPLINSIIDLIEGYIPIGIARGVFAGLILLSIALGMFLSMTLIGINSF